MGDNNQIEVNMLGEFIHRARLDKAYTLRDLALISGVSYSQINKIERGEAKTPSESTLSKLAKSLSIDENEMLLVAGQLPNNLQPEVLRSILNRSITKKNDDDSNSYEDIVESSYENIEDDYLIQNDPLQPSGFFFFFDEETSFLDDMRDLILKHNPELSEEKVKELSFDMSDFYMVRLNRLKD